MILKQNIQPTLGQWFSLASACIGIGLCACAPEQAQVLPAAKAFVATDLQPQALAPGLEPQTLVVACLQADSVYEVSLKTLALGRRLHLPNGPGALIPDAERQSLYCLHRRANIISILSGRPLRAERSLGTGDMALASGALRPGANELWICDGISALHVLVPKAMQIKDRLQVGRYPQKVIFAPDGRTALITVKGENALVFWDIPERREAGRIAVGIYPRDVVIAGNLAAVSNFGSHDVSLIDLGARKETARIKVRRQPNSLAVQGSTLWVACEDSYRLEAIDLKQQKVLGTVKLGFYPGALLALPDDALAITDPKGNRVAVVKLK